MESLSDTKWDVVISGTGLSQSLLALALSRSGKNILHVDADEIYGGPEAALSLQDADAWVEQHQAEGDVFRGASLEKDAQGLSPSRAYSLALAPQIIHTKAELLSQLVSSKAFKQIEFLAVGSFHVYQPPSETESKPTLQRIPSTREDVFANTAIAAKSKRYLMKFLKFVVEYDGEAQQEVWKPKANEPLGDFLASEFKLDEALQSYILALTLSLDGNVSVAAGLSAIHRHMTSMGKFGPGFAAVYAKWGGLSEVAQVGCRAAAVGGAIYMLGTGVEGAQCRDAEVDVKLTNGTTVTSKLLVQDAEHDSTAPSLSRLIAVIDSPLASIFESVIEGAPTPAVAVVAFPTGTISTDTGEASEYPLYAMVHSGDSGECPIGQSVVYLCTVSSPNSRSLLNAALTTLASLADGDESVPKCLYKLGYEQSFRSTITTKVDGSIISIPPPSLDLAFNDQVLRQIESAWEAVTAGDEPAKEAAYMDFEDREGAQDDDHYD